MKHRARPLYIFLVSTATLYAALTGLDSVYQTQSSPNLLDSGNLFLAQCLALLGTTFWLLAKQGRRAAALPWVVASVASLLCIVGSYLIFYQYPRVQAEADGPSDVRYMCVLGTQYDTVISLVGERGYEDGALTNNICILKNAPMAASNILFIKNDSTFNGNVLLFLAEGVIVGSFLSTRYIVRRASR